MQTGGTKDLSGLKWLFTLQTAVMSDVLRKSFIGSFLAGGFPAMFFSGAAFVMNSSVCKYSSSR